jgi:ABC-type spermidine/putrescine transport system permease subunit I
MLDVANLLVAATNNAPLDWAYGTAASVVFVALIAVPAAVLNSREHRRRQASKAEGQRQGG